MEMFSGPQKLFQRLRLAFGFVVGKVGCSLVNLGNKANEDRTACTSKVALKCDFGRAEGFLLDLKETFCLRADHSIRQKEQSL